MSCSFFLKMHEILCIFHITYTHAHSQQLRYPGGGSKFRNWEILESHVHAVTWHLECHSLSQNIQLQTHLDISARYMVMDIFRSSTFIILLCGIHLGRGEQMRDWTCSEGWGSLEIFLETFPPGCVLYFPSPTLISMNEMTRELNPYTDLDCEHNDVCEEELQTNLRKDFTITEGLLLVDSAY